MSRRMGKLAFFGLLIALVLYLVAWPAPIDPVAWEAPPAPGYQGPHARNTRLQNLKRLSIGANHGPEHIIADAAGRLYTAVVSGAILRLDPAAGSEPEIFVNTGGRPLGLAFDAAGNLLIADAYKGLLSAAPDGALATLTDRVGDSPILYADAVIAARDGRIYFSDASQRFSASAAGGTFEASILDILEASATGRILVYDPRDQSTQVLTEGLSFANGIALDSKEEHLYVCETGRFRVIRIALSGPERGVARPFLENLPGYPDNLMRGENGRYWVGLAKPRSALVDSLSDQPFLRKVVIRLPKFLLPVPPAYGHVFAFNEAGEITADLQDPSGAYPETTSVTETGERLYIHSLHADYIGYLERADAGVD